MNSSPVYDSKEAEILHQLDDAIIELDHKGYFLFANTKAEQLFNKQAKDLAGKQIWTEFPEEVNTIFYTTLKNCLNERIRATEPVILQRINSPVLVKISPSVHGAIVQLTKVVNTEKENLSNADSISNNPLSVITGQQLKENQNFIESIASTTPDFITIQDANTNQILYKNSNDFLNAILDLDIHKLSLEERPYAMLDSEYIDKAKKFLEERKWLDDNEVKETELKLKSNGWIKIRSKVFKRNEYGKASQIISFTTDVTRTKEAELEIKEQAYFIQSINELLPDIATVVEFSSKKIIYTNRDLIASLGFDAQEIIHMTFADRANLFHKDDLPAIQSYYERFTLLKDGDINEVEYRLKNKKGDWISLSVRGKVFKRDDKGNVSQVLMIGHDITENKKAEVELVKLKLLQQKEILNAVVNAQEDERRKIAETLHNGLGQLLYATKMRAESVQPDPKFIEYVKLKYEVDQHLEEAIDLTKNISRQLSPLFLETFGLVSAIEHIIEKFKSDTLFITFKFISNKERFKPEIEIAVYRIIQELTNNIIKHSNASIANIRVESTDSTLTIIVKDNGDGFGDLSIQDPKTGMGLKMIENRVNLLNGTMTIESNKETGTKTSIILAI